MQLIHYIKTKKEIHIISIYIKLSKLIKYLELNSIIEKTFTSIKIFLKYKKKYEQKDIHDLEWDDIMHKK